MKTNIQEATRYLDQLIRLKGELEPQLAQLKNDLKDTQNFIVRFRQEEKETTEVINEINKLENTVRVVPKPQAPAN